MLQKIAKSKSFDLLGVLIVVAISIASGYLTETLADVTHWGHWTVFVPFGIISIINSILSIYSTRLTGRMNNLGNVVGIANVVLSGTIDYILGNQAAVITYPVTFIIYTVAIEHWKRTEKYKSSRALKGCSPSSACSSYPCSSRLEPTTLAGRTALLIPSSGSPLSPLA